MKDTGYDQFQLVKKTMNGELKALNNHQQINNSFPWNS